MRTKKKKQKKAIVIHRISVATNFALIENGFFCINETQHTYIQTHTHTHKQIQKKHSQVFAKNTNAMRPKKNKQRKNRHPTYDSRTQKNKKNKKKEQKTSQNILNMSGCWNKCVPFF